MIVRRIGRFVALAILAALLPGVSSCSKNGSKAPLASLEEQEYANADSLAIPAPELANPGFEEGTAGWMAGSGFRSTPGQGTQQTRALFYERTNPAEYALAEQKIDLSPSGSYRFSALVKTEGVQAGPSDAHGGATVGLEYSGKGKWLGGSYLPGITGTKDWTLVEGMGKIPADADSVRIVLYLTKNATGKVWFDSVTVLPAARPIKAVLLQPVQEYFLPEDGRFLLRWDINKEFKLDKAKLRVRVAIAEGDKRVTAVDSQLDGKFSKGDLGAIPPGSYKLTASLLDPEKKLILHEQSFPVACRDLKTAPAGAVRMDDKGRTWIDGKPSMPVGLYVYGQELKQRLGDISASPFNCVMPYESLHLQFPGTFLSGIEATREVFDACAAKGVRIIYSMKDLYENYRCQGREVYPGQWNGITGETEIVGAIVKNFKDHPGLLAWYVGDEIPLGHAPRVEERRRLLHQLDPWHPSWIVQDKFKEKTLDEFVSCSDVFGVDPYPIEGKEPRDMRIVLSAMEQSREAMAPGTGGLPLWVVPQAHNTGLYNPAFNKDRETLLANSSVPSEEQMRSISLLMAIQGARGFVFYSYFDLIKPLALPDYEQRWKELCNVGALLRELQPFLYSDETAPVVTVKTIQGTVNAAAYKTADGKVKVLVTGSGPGASEAEIAVAGTSNLSARYGKTESLGGGSYRFKGADICSDVLEGIFKTP